MTSTDAVIGVAAQLAETLSSFLANNKHETRELYDDHSKEVQSLSSILSEIERKHENNVDMKSLLTRPYSIDGD